MNKIRFFLFFLFAPLLLSAQFDHAQMFRAYLKGDLTYWGETLRKLQHASFTDEELHLLVNYEYGYIPWCIEKKRDDEAKFFISSLSSHLDILEERGYDSSSICVYRSAICAYQISYNKWKFAYFASKCIEFVNKAFEINPNSPLVLSLKGNVDFYKPALFGGSKKNALSYFKRSIERFEEEHWTEKNWNYIATLLCCAQAFEKTGNKEEALVLCKKILQKAPDFVYVRDVYHPALLKKQLQ